MADFMELAKFMQEKQIVDHGQQISDLKSKKAQMNDAMEIQIKQHEIQKNQYEKSKADIKYRQKVEKMQADLMKQLIDDSLNRPTAAGPGMLDAMGATEQAPDAEGLPFIDANASLPSSQS